MAHEKCPLENKLYSSNNRRLKWETAVIATQIRANSIDHAFLHGLITRTDGLSVVFFRRLFVKCAAKISQPHKSAQPKLSEKLNLLCRHLSLVDVRYGNACCLCLYITPMIVIITSFSTMILVITVKSFISKPHACTVCVVLEMVQRNTIDSIKSIFPISPHTRFVRSLKLHKRQQIWKTDNLTKNSPNPNLPWIS